MKELKTKEYDAYIKHEAPKTTLGVPPQLPPSQPMVFLFASESRSRRGVLLSERPELCPTGRVLD